MSDYISRTKLIDKLNHTRYESIIYQTYTRESVMSVILSHDIDEDVRSEIKGHWEDGNNICPKCGEDKFKGLEADIYADWQPNFCPNCGADMREPKGEKGET